ncbi:MAG: nickel-dependent hydrogenase large subunit [Anaeromyxobacteraceae bacterium]
MIDAERFLGEAERLAKAGWRLVLINATGLPPAAGQEEGDVDLVWTFEQGGKLQHLRERVEHGARVPSLSALFGSAFLYENEIRELLRRGRDRAHRRLPRRALPDLPEGPVLRQGHQGAARRPGQGVMKRTFIPFGPQHPVLPEPIVLDLVLEDERVVDAVPAIGYVHRGLEAMVEKVEFTDFGNVADRICGICSFMHGMGYAMGVERIMKVDVPARAQWLRLIWAELSRIHSHLLWLGLAADGFGFENLFMHCWRLRERVIDLFDQTTGGRIIFSVNRIGGVARDVAPDALQHIERTLDQLREDLREVRKVFFEDASIHHRLAGVGHLSREEAVRTGAVGPMARASGVALDVRMGGDEDFPRYHELAFEPVLEQDGDCLARCKVRVRELDQAIDLVKQAIARIPPADGPLVAKVRGTPSGEAFVRLEQPRGEVVYYLRGNGTKFLERFRARTPTFGNLPAMIQLLKDCDLADVPNIILTIDPCISCTER